MEIVRGKIERIGVRQQAAEPFVDRNPILFADSDIHLSRHGAILLGNSRDWSRIIQRRSGLMPVVIPSQRRAGQAAEGRAAQTLQVRRSDADRSEEHTSELQSLMRISSAVFCLKKKTKRQKL